jgi:hypothetical protein
MFRTLTGGACFALTCQLVAQSPQPPKRPISLTETAANLARDGFARADARAILAAARILEVVELGSRGVHPEQVAAGPAGPWVGPLSRMALLRLSSKVAVDEADWMVADLAASELSSSPTDSLPRQRGAAGGPIWADAFVPSGGENRYTIDFEGGESPNLLQISAGKAAATLECSLFEKATGDRAAVRVRSLSGACVLQWKQQMQGRVTLRIRNLGADTYYVLSSN